MVSVRQLELLVMVKIQAATHYLLVFSKKIDRLKRPGVNFINVLRAAFVHAEPKSLKKRVKLSVFLRFRDLRLQKLCAMLVKLTPSCYTINPD